MKDNSKKAIVYLSLGTNLGNRELTIEKAICLIEKKIGKIVKRSGFYHSLPWGFVSDNEFINIAACIKTSLLPREVLERAKEIETLLGRKQKTIEGKYQDREIDIDILLYNDIIIDEPDLKIPHPHMYERDFVMIPLREIFKDIPTLS